MAKPAKTKTTKTSGRPVPFWKRWLRRFVFFGAFCLLSVVTLNLWLVIQTKPRLYRDIQAIPAQKVGLVLGTSSRVVGGSPNAFFHNRMDAAAELYQQGKVQYLLISGDNRAKYYNEPMQMQEALTKRGVPVAALIQDYAGLRTLDSIVRAQKVFGQESLIIVSQAPHNHRALYIARHQGIDAYGYAAASPPLANGWKVRLREYVARMLMYLDLYIWDTQPRHLGEPVPIPPPAAAGFPGSP